MNQVLPLAPTTMLPLLSWTLQSTLLLGAGWLLYRYVLRQERFFTYNRRFLLFTPWLALGLPGLLALVKPWLPAIQNPATGLLNGGLLPELTISSGAAGANLSTQLPGWLPSSLLLLYLAGVLVLLGRLGMHLLHLWLAARRFPQEARPGYVLVHTGGRRPISSFGRWVFWDDSTALSSDEARVVLAHELVHVQQGHSWERLSLAVAQALLWFCPFIHFYPPALALVHEFLADKDALRATAPSQAAPVPESYTALLARLALRQLHPDLPLTHSFTQSFTLTRIRMLTSQTPARRWKQWLLLPIGAFLFVAVACENAPDLDKPATTATSKDSQYGTPPPPPPPPYTTNAADTPPPPPPPALLNVEVMPEYPGGQTALFSTLLKNTRYPAVALQQKLQGKALVSFIVDTDGSISAVKLERGVTAAAGQQAAATALNEEALRVVRELPGKWTPGLNKGKRVAVQFAVPISFAL